jgi:hypothetical protein
MAQAARPQSEQVYYQRVAWTWLLVFFALFCVLVAVAGYAGWQYYATAMNPVEGSVLRSHVNAGVSIQRVVGWLPKVSNASRQNVIRAPVNSISAQRSPKEA